MKKKKILVVSATCFPSIGGIQTYLKNFFNYKSDLFEFEILTSNLNSNDIIIENYDGIKIYRVPVIAPDQSFFFSIKLLPVFKRIIKNVDLVHLHGYHNLFTFILFLSRKIPVVFTPHFHETPKKKSRILMFKIYNLLFGRYFFAKSDIIILNNQLNRKIISRKFNINPSKMIVLPEGVNVIIDKEIEKQSEIVRPRILSIGRLERNKGIYRVLNVFYRLIKLYPESVLNIVGSGTERNNIEKIIQKDDNLKSIILHSNISNNEIKNLYKTTDIFLMLSDYESFGLAFAEAIASGIPSIGVNRGGVLQYAIDKHNSLLVSNPNDFEDILNKLIYLIKDFEIRNKLSKNGKEIRKIYSWEKNALMTYSIYNKLLKK